MDSREMVMARTVCSQIMSLTESGVIEMQDLLKITDLCIEACERKKAFIDEITKPEIRTLQ